MNKRKFPKLKIKPLNIRDKILLAVAHVVEKHTWKVILANVLLTLISVIYTVENLQFQTGRSQLISEDQQYRKNFKKFREEFGDYDGLIVAAKGTNPDRLKEYMEALGSKLKSDPAHFMDIFYKINTDYFRDKFFLFLSEKEMDELCEKLQENEEMISRINEEQSLVNFFRQINYKISKAMVGHLVSGLLDSGGEEEKEEDPMDLSLINNILRQMDQWLEGEKNFRSPWISFLNEGGKNSGEGYLASPNEAIYMMTVNPVENANGFAKSKAAVELLRAHIHSLKVTFPNVTAGVTGSAALESDEMIASQQDTMKASLVALIGVTMCFVFAFRGLVKPFLAIIALVVSLCWTLGWTTLFIGHLSVISVVFITILIGLGIDFGIHLIMRYEEERIKNSSSVERALERAILGTGKGILVGATTTALAFYTMAFADFLGIVELGLIAGSGVLLSLVSMLVFLPAMLLIVERKVFRIKLFALWNRPEITLHLSLLKRMHEFPKLLLAVGAVGALFSVYHFSDLKFDYNLLRLQNKATESVRFEMDIINNAERSTWYGAIIANSLKEARRLKKELKNLPTVSDVESILSVYPDNQEEKIRMVRTKAESMPKFEALAEETEESVSIKRLAKTLNKIHFKLRDENDTWSPEKKPEEGSIREARMLMEKILDKLDKMKKEAVPPLSQYQDRLFEDYRDKFGNLLAGMNPTPIVLEKLPKPMKDRFIGKTGKYLLQVYPKENIWDREPLDRFIADLRSLDPNATGLAIQAGESARLMKEGYVQGGIYALFTIVLITFFSFKKLKNSILAMLPLFVGFVWMISLMEIFDLRFNLANLVILPLIIGIGVDNGVHIVARYQEGDIHDPVSIIFMSTGKAIFLCSITTMIGFGSLMVASHYGIFSIGLLLSLGVGSCLAASTTILPILFRFSEKNTIAMPD